jgi:hypothetical protein
LRAGRKLNPMRDANSKLIFFRFLGSSLPIELNQNEKLGLHFDLFNETPLKRYRS